MNGELLDERRMETVGKRRKRRMVQAKDGILYEIIGFAIL